MIEPADDDRESDASVEHLGGDAHAAEKPDSRAGSNLGAVFRTLSFLSFMLYNGPVPHVEELAERFDGEAEPATVSIVVGDDRYDLPPDLADAVRELIRASTSTGRVINVAALPVEITTGQAADLLSVSRPTVVQLIESGELAATRVGTRRRLRTEDVLRYRARRSVSAEQRRRLNAVVELSEELGLYDEPDR